MCQATFVDNERTKILGKYNGKKIVVEGIIGELRETKIHPIKSFKDIEKIKINDKKDNIENNNDLAEAHENKEIVNPFYFLGLTLLKDVIILDTKEELGHIWISEDIYKQIPEVSEGDKVKVTGVVREYIKHNGKEMDYCINEFHVEKSN